MGFVNFRFAAGLLVSGVILLSSAYASEISLAAKPDYVKSITNPYEQYNDIHPTWSADGNIISFERYDTGKHEIILSDRKGKKLQTIAISSASEFSLDDLLGETSNSMSFNSGISWAPDNSQFVFTSNGKFNNFDLYLGNFGQSQSKRITFHHQKDSQATWSPNGKYIAFVSSRNGHAQLYRYDTESSEIVKLLDKDHDTFYPSWSPDSTKLVFMQERNNTYQIFVIDNIEKPEKSLRQVTELNSHSIKPSWSMDGSKLAFYHSSNSSNQDEVWDILVVDYAAGSLITSKTINKHIVANNVILNSESGPTWLPDNSHIAYVSNENERYNPIHLVNIHSKKTILFNTDTKLNKDLSCSKDGILAFQTQDRQWSRIFIAKLPDLSN